MRMEVGPLLPGLKGCTITHIYSDRPFEMSEGRQRTYRSIVIFFLPSGDKNKHLNSGRICNLESTSFLVWIILLNKCVILQRLNFKIFFLCL